MEGPMDETFPQDDGAPVEHLKIEYSAYYAVQPPLVERDEPPALFLAIHGYGESCKAFIRYFAPLQEKNILVVAPQGPNQFYWRQNGKVGFAWITGYRPQQTITDLMAYMGRLLKDLESKYPFDPRRVFIFGFSQGAALGYRLAASGLLQPKGLIACGADLPADVAERLGDMEGTPILVIHGKHDSLMDFDKALEAEARLKEGGFDVTTLYFDGDHQIPLEEFEVITDWLDARGC